MNLKIKLLFEKIKKSAPLCRFVIKRSNLFIKSNNMHNNGAASVSKIPPQTIDSRSHSFDNLLSEKYLMPYWLSLVVL